MTKMRMLTVRMTITKIVTVRMTKMKMLIARMTMTMTKMEMMTTTPDLARPAGVSSSLFSLTTSAQLRDIWGHLLLEAEGVQWVI